MKSEDEIKREIDATVKTLKNYHKAYAQQKIPFDVMSDKAIDLHATISALKWVLGENDRYD